ncbi:hypothetical protein Q5741_13680 [Paenibacillus sp. JX-17]|uniref:Uncharacterized protein n=1 Tax=Paenibacillus lacisoli TaxID=3064525 RepID=A0ABT9CDW3_9BACL|nr:hypothetical protein [Paenibacillus sp. JX-17]MDO7907457.1 hypothetical protein [Paenibacillus sp. JX-17]
MRLGKPMESSRKSRLWGALILFLVLVPAAYDFSLGFMNGWKAAH